ncbi:mitochondrial PRK14971 domain-containing protein [Andalucia godoyi]|uniref:Mitochondrial PRK14971 domain-containing protein n=1 Tax=Andalucia godoyi TaxID=505711 RepID=A0A8K0AHU3_ANDGO|nr:mitochondrial PRK14971 domain-containing protein [Andalucia godoyi]|eukprot:ANDGO_01023.mRNA.1 mitochondrial PRK14971 domain-containing protein
MWSRAIKAKILESTKRSETSSATTDSRKTGLSIVSIGGWTQQSASDSNDVYSGPYRLQKQNADHQTTSFQRRGSEPNLSTWKMAPVSPAVETTSRTSADDEWVSIRPDGSLTLSNVVKLKLVYRQLRKDCIERILQQQQQQHPHPHPQLHPNGSEQSQSITASSKATMHRSSSIVFKIVSWAGRAKVRTRIQRYESLRKEIQLLVIQGVVIPEIPFSVDPESIPYRFQGNLDLYTDSALLQRDRIREHAHFESEVKSWWDLALKSREDPLMLDKDEYLYIVDRIYRIVVPELMETSSGTELAAILQEDWKNDADGASSISQRAFSASLFDLADTWVEEIDPDSYVDFLKKLRKKVLNTDYVKRRDGILAALLKSKAASQVQSPAPAPPPRKSGHTKRPSSARTRLPMPRPPPAGRPTTAMAQPEPEYVVPSSPEHHAPQDEQMLSSKSEQVTAESKPIRSEVAHAITNLEEFEFFVHAADVHGVEKAIFSRILDDLRRGIRPADHSGFWKLVRLHNLDVTKLLELHKLSETAVPESSRHQRLDSLPTSVRPSLPVVQKSASSGLMDRRSDFFVENLAVPILNRPSIDSQSLDEFVQEVDSEGSWSEDGSPIARKSSGVLARPLSANPATLTEKFTGLLRVSNVETKFEVQQFAPRVQDSSVVGGPGARPRSAPMRNTTTKTKLVDAWVSEQVRRRPKSSRVLHTTVEADGLLESGMTARTAVDDYEGSLRSPVNADTEKRRSSMSFSRKPSSRPWTASSMNSMGQKDLENILSNWQKERQFMNSRSDTAVLPEEVDHWLKGVDPSFSVEAALTTIHPLIPKVDLSKLKIVKSETPTVSYGTTIGSHTVRTISPRPESAKSSGSVTYRPAIESEITTNANAHQLVSCRSSSAVTPGSRLSRPESARNIPSRATAVGIQPLFAASWKGRPSSARTSLAVRASDRMPTETPEASQSPAEPMSTRSAVGSNSSLQVRSALTVSFDKFSRELESLRRGGGRPASARRPSAHGR